MCAGETEPITFENEPRSESEPSFAWLREGWRKLSQAKALDNDPHEAERHAFYWRMLMAFYESMPDISTMSSFLPQRGRNGSDEDAEGREYLRFGMRTEQPDNSGASGAFIAAIKQELDEMVVRIRHEHTKWQASTAHRVDETLVVMDRGPKGLRTRYLGENASCHALRVFHWFLSIGDYMQELSDEYGFWKELTQGESMLDISVVALFHDVLEDVKDSGLKCNSEGQITLSFGSAPFYEMEYHRKSVEGIARAKIELESSLPEGWRLEQRENELILCGESGFPWDEWPVKDYVLVPISAHEAKVRLIRLMPEPRLSVHQAEGLAALTSYSWQREQGVALARQRHNWLTDSEGDGEPGPLTVALGKVTAQTMGIHRVIARWEERDRGRDIVLLDLVKLMDILANLTELAGMTKKGAEKAQRYLLEELAKATTLEQKLQYQVRKLVEMKKIDGLPPMPLELLECVSRFAELIHHHGSMDWWINPLQARENNTPPSIAEVVAIVDHAYRSLDVEQQSIQ